MNFCLEDVKKKTILKGFSYLSGSNKIRNFGSNESENLKESEYPGNGLSYLKTNNISISYFYAALHSYLQKGKSLMPENLEKNIQKMYMETLTQLVVEKTGIPAETAETAVNTVLNFIKEKLPAGLGEKVIAIVQDRDGDGDVDFSDIVGGLKDSIGGIFG